MKKISLLALLCSLMLLFAACGSDTPDTGTTTGGDDTATTDTGEDTDGGTDGATDGGEEDTGTTDGATDGTTDGTDGTDGTTDGTDGATDGTDGETTPPPAGVCEDADPLAETDVVFGDDRIETAAKTSLATVGVTVGPDEAINCSDILQLLGVTVRGESGANGLPTPESNLASLEGLENATAMETIEINTQRVSDISPLGAIPSLREVVLPNNQITDLSPLANPETLTKVFVAFNRTLSDVSTLLEREWPGADDDVRLQGTRVTNEDAEALVAAGVETVQLGDGSFIGPNAPDGGTTEPEPTPAPDEGDEGGEDETPATP